MRGHVAATVALLLAVTMIPCQAADKRDDSAAARVENATPSIPPKTHPDSARWQNLFSADLSDAICSKGDWVVQDGELTSTKGGNILTKAQYANYIIDFEFKNGPGANSGVFIYCSDLKNWIPNKLEIQLLDDYSPHCATFPKTALCGAIYGRLPPLRQAVKKAGQWNRMTVWCLGPKVYVLLNEELVSQLDMTQWTSGKKTPDGRDIPAIYNKPLADLPTKGHIGLQGKHGDTANYFRNLKIKVLSAQ